MIDSKEISPWFLNSLIMMTTRYFIFNIRRVFLVNFELNKLSSEVIGLLSSPIYTHFVLALSDKKYLVRHIRKRYLHIEYGGLRTK